MSISTLVNRFLDALTTPILSSDSPGVRRVRGLIPDEGGTALFHEHLLDKHDPA